MFQLNTYPEAHRDRPNGPSARSGHACFLVGLLLGEFRALLDPIGSIAQVCSLPTGQLLGSHPFDFPLFSRRVGHVHHWGECFPEVTP